MTQAPDRRAFTEIRFGLTYRDGKVSALPEEWLRCGRVR